MHRLIKITFSITLLALYACTYDSDRVILDEIGNEEYITGDYYIDEYGNEGIVGYVSSTYSSPKYFIVISADEAYLPWGPMFDNVRSNDTISNGMLVNPSFGLSMLQLMKQKGIGNYPAMEWCDNKNGNAQYSSGSSWRLPTRQELGLIFGSIQGRLQTNSEMTVKFGNLNKALADIGAETINPSHVYWTCQEDYEVLSDEEHTDYDRENRAVPVTVNDTPPEYKNLWLKKNKYYVRAIKYIYYYGY